MIGGIGDWTCGAGVIEIIFTCKAIVQILEAFDFVGVGRPHVSCSSASSLAAFSAASTSDHGFL